ncbi:hypothetical protein [Streptomyces purpureus]|uniref:hypothetical protein n=1 Tax=Streptomyces purpureus TaxID=1951 RepID=UPI0003A3941F|nr:hypothetical protein [Streptomyces purpureus]
MSRRVSLPGADELFRTTGGMALQASSPRRSANGEPRVPPPAAESDTEAAAASPAAPATSSAASSAEEHSSADEEAAEPRTRTPEPAPADPPRRAAPASGEPVRRRGRAANRRPSGRERHDEKITVYVSAEELMDLEHARLVLRGEHGLAVDRGRIVREAVAVVLADLESRGDASILVRRLRGR